MKFTARILATGIVGLTLFACAPLQPAPPPPAGLATYHAFCDAPTNSDPFLKHVHFLQYPFVPTYPYNNSPPIDSTTDVPTGTPISKDLEDAFNAAAPKNLGFQQQLCGLNGILINPCAINNYDPSKCIGMQDTAVANNSWGFRTPTPGGATRYIALSLALWQNGYAPKLLEFETRKIQALLLTIWPNALTARPPSFSSLAPNNADASAMSVLAALAHEFGHVYWYDNFVKTPGGTANTTDPNGFCGGTFYSSADWPYPIDVPSGRWIRFGEIRNQDPQSDVMQLPGLLRNSHNEWGDYLHAIFQKGRWAGAIAAFSPDEDFVKTFELFTLVNSNPGLTSLIISIKGNHQTFNDDIMNNLSPGLGLWQKYQCFVPQLSTGR
jgi:hypothetical protein